MNLGALVAIYEEYKPIYYFKTDNIKEIIPVFHYNYISGENGSFYDIDHFKTQADSDYSGFKSFLIKYEE